MRNNRGRVGFTLVELLITIVIIAVLAAVSIPRFFDRAIHSKETALKSHLKLARTAVERFKADTCMLPVSLADLASETPPDYGVSGGNKTALDPATYHGPYIDQEPMDALVDQPLDYQVDASDGYQIRASATGTATDGTDYQTW